MDKRIPNIEDSFEKTESYPRVIERYYTPLYFKGNDGPSKEHHCLLLHSNKICLVTLAPTHPIIENKKRISKLDFQITPKVDRLENTVRGKGKKGGQHLMPNSVLCRVECEDGTNYAILGCIKGKLLEINQALLKNPNLIVEKPFSLGFVAIILPSLKDLEASKMKLMSQKQYKCEFLQCCNI